MSTNDLKIPAAHKGGAVPADNWVDTTRRTEGPTKKMSLEFPEQVHRATKSGAAMRGNTIVGEVIELVSARNGLAPWPADVVASVLQQVAAEPDEITWPANVVASVQKQAAEQAPSTPAPAKPRAARAKKRGER